MTKQFRLASLSILLLALVACELRAQEDQPAEDILVDAEGAVWDTTVSDEGPEVVEDESREMTTPRVTPALPPPELNVDDLPAVELEPELEPTGRVVEGEGRAEAVKESEPASPTPPAGTEAPVVEEAGQSDLGVDLAPASAVPPEARLGTLGGEEREKLARLLASQEEVRRQQREVDAMRKIAQADEAFKARNFARAAELYNEGLKALPLRPATAETRKRAMARAAEAEYGAALEMLKAGQRKEAGEAATKALERYPDHVGLRRLKARVDEWARAEAALTPEQREARTIRESTAQRKARVRDLMANGSRYMAARDFERARASFEAVLALEPENPEAMRYLKELSDRKYSSSTIERQATAMQMTSEVRDKWNPPDYKEIKPPEVKRGVETSEQPLLDKMDRIIIPELDFRQANIHDVVRFLNQASIEADKDEPDPAKKGVNIILNLGAGAGAPATEAPAPADPFAPAPASRSAVTPTYEITFSARYISLRTALALICQVANLKQRIEGNIVMIVPPDYAAGDIIVKMYPVEPTFIERVRETSAAMAAPPPSRQVGGRDFIQMEVTPMDAGVPDLKAYFERMGMTFPRNASITYNSAIGKVIVANTAENLALFEKLLAELNVIPKQVEIEARFVEVNETDLQEMGLQWLLNDNWELAMKKGSPRAPISSRPRIQMDANASGGGFTRGLRFWSPAAEGGMIQPRGGGQGTLGRVLSLTSVLTNPELSVVLHALEQNGNADLLSAPKVMTRSGQEAVMKVVTEYIYPTEFEVQAGQIQSLATGQGSIVQETVVVPQSFQTREVGVILQVLPEVNPDGSVINLQLTPSVVTEPTWQQYGSTIRRADGSEQQLNMPQPFFHVRTVTTQISIYDGATVVMGGLITEDLKKVNDKIPVLGDLPLIGALFRSKSEYSQKKNLLIFVTARLVDPAGKLIRQPESTVVDTAKASAE